MVSVTAKRGLQATESGTSGVRTIVPTAIVTTAHVAAAHVAAAHVATAHVASAHVAAAHVAAAHVAAAHVASAHGSRPPNHVSGVIAASGQAPVSQRSGPVSYRGVAPRVILIEDDAITRGKLEQMLSKRGAEVISASGPSEAVYLMSTLDEPNGRASIVILDVLMPGLDGPLFVNMLRSDPRLLGAPIVLISALSAPVLEQTMRNWRADGFILKSRGLLHIDEAFEAWFARLAVKISGHPASQGSGRPPSSSSVG